MTKFEQLDALLEQGNGYITTRAVTEQGISKPYFAEYVRSRDLERVAHGVYQSPDAWPDDMYILHLRKPDTAINDTILYRAFLATSSTRRTTEFIPQFAAILESVESNTEMQKIWNKFCNDNDYVLEHDWHKIMASVKVMEKRLEQQRERIKRLRSMER